MFTKEQIAQELDSLSQSEIELIAQYLAFLKYQSRLKSVPVVDESQLAAMYAGFAEADHELAEEGLSDYADALAREDAQ